MSARSLFRTTAERTGDNDSLILEGLRVFRTGTFRDMWGFESTWDEAHLEQMIFHFGLLRSQNILPDVPVRLDHSISVEKICGYYLDLYRDEEDPEYLSATVELLDPVAVERWHRKLLRARSIEIGMYETNDKRTYYPTVMGLAFVDLGAVEGLYGNPNTGRGFFRQVLMSKEMPVSGNGEPAPQPTTPPETPPVTPPGDEGGEQEQGTATPPVVPTATATATAPAAPAPPEGTQPPATPAQTDPAPAQPPTQQQHSQAGGHQAVFRINGLPCSDFQAVQQHISMLEETVSESTKMGREAFVEQLAKDNKIAASLVGSLQAHAQGLSAEQFASFRTAWEAAPAVPGLASFGNEHQDANAGGGGTPPPTGSSDTLSQEDIDLGVVRQHKSAGMDFEKIKRGAAFKRLDAAGKAPDLSTL